MRPSAPGPDPNPSPAIPPPASTVRERLHGDEGRRGWNEYRTRWRHEHRPGERSYHHDRRARDHHHGTLRRHDGCAGNRVHHHNRRARDHHYGPWGDDHHAAVPVTTPGISRRRQDDEDDYYPESEGERQASHRLSLLVCGCGHRRVYSRLTVSPRPCCGDASAPREWTLGDHLERIASEKHPLVELFPHIKRTPSCVRRGRS